MSNYQLHCGDCLEIMPTLEPGSIDAIITDPPYGTTACKWDSVIPFDPMWANIKRLIKPRGAVVLFGSQPFTSALVMSNPKWFKYCWVWNKKLAGNGILAKVQPLKVHEDIIVFSESSCTYIPQMKQGKPRYKGGIKDNHGTFNGAKSCVTWNDTYYPATILDYSGAGMRASRVHPTQKPVDLMAYLIRTYTNPGDVVLDFTCGSGSTGVAAIQEGRRFVGIEKDANYFEVAQRRIANAAPPLPLLDAVVAIGG